MEIETLFESLSLRDFSSLCWLSRENDLCVAHYTCPMFNGEFINDYGDAGIPVARLMITYACAANKKLLKRKRERSYVE